MAELPDRARLFQIKEDDLADLERILPDLIGGPPGALDNAYRTKIRRVQKIVQDIRWNYGPHVLMEKVPPPPLDRDQPPAETLE